jgi:hypothetical protein
MNRVEWSRDTIQSIAMAAGANDRLDESRVRCPSEFQTF